MGVNDIVLALDDVHSGYGEIEVLRGVSCSVRRGTTTCIIGANGAGKSTLLKTIFGLLRPSRGTMSFHGLDIAGKSSKELLKMGISYVPQGRCNFPAMSVQENLEMGAFTRADDRVKADIEAVYGRFAILRERRHVAAGNLSGGQQQVLEIAMSLLLHPELLLIDEPSLGLDPTMVEEVFAVINGVKGEGTTVLMVEQNARKALANSDYAFVLELGKNWLQGTGKEILENREVGSHYLGL